MILSFYNWIFEYFQYLWYIQLFKNIFFKNKYQQREQIFKKIPFLNSVEMWKEERVNEAF